MSTKEPAIAVFDATNQHLKLELRPGSVAPRYEKYRALKCTGVVITERGMSSGLPLVDFQLEDEDGEFHVLMLSGRLVNVVAVAIRGVNLRNHGVEEP